MKAASGGKPQTAGKRKGAAMPLPSGAHHIACSLVLIHTQFLFQVVDIHAALAEAFVTNQIPVQWDVGLDAVDDEFVQCIAHAHHGLFTGRTVSDQLADPRVIVRRNRVAAVQVRIDANAVAAWRMEVVYLTGTRQELLRVFGVNPAFQRVAADDHVFLLDRQLVAGGDAEHLLDDIHTGDHFGDRMLDLHARVHFDEVEATVFIEELEGAGAAVADLDAGIDTALEHFGARLLVNVGGRGFFQHLLVTALQRAVAVVEVDGVALAVREHLDFHVTRVAEEFFQVDHRVAERRAGFGAGQLGRFDQVFFLVHHAHAATTAAASGLDDHRVAYFTSDAQRFLFVFRQRAVRTGNHRHAGFDHGVLGGNLVTHQANGFRFRADEGEAGLFHLLGEIRVLGEKAVARVDGGGAGNLCRGDDRRDVQI